ncbi:MAG: ABC transporter substrate-binding protein [Anaerolineae bacterium]
MKKLFTLFTVALLLMVALVPVMAQDAAEVTFRCYQDGTECDVLSELLAAFEEANPDVDVIVDIVPYQTIDEQLPIQVEAGEAPDIARVTNFGVYQGFYLDLTPYLDEETAAAWEANFPAPVLAAMSNDGAGDTLSGFPDLFSVTAPFINRTLFEQAGVAVPSDENPEASWQDWTAAAAEVAAALSDGEFQVYAVAIDRTGHRFAGPAMSMGATLINDEGSFTVDTEGFRMMAELLKSWHDDSITPVEVWLGSGGSYAAAADFFINGQLAVYMSGSWQVGRFGRDIADAFDWEVVPNPTGEGGSTGIAGGSGIIAFEGAENPEAVARVMAYLVQPEVYSEYSARILSLPAHSEVAEAGVDFQTDNEAVAEALNTFAAEIPKLQDQAVALNVHPFAFAYYRNSADRLTQYIVGELSLEEALTNLQEDIDAAIAEAQS